ncbi:hypothetical protein GB937_009861 [Aspergillus fischeri]|nr:hypothetical protein GB937_009861 [Aspergillus fischeri]
MNETTSPSSPIIDDSALSEVLITRDPRIIKALHIDHTIWSGAAEPWLAEVALARKEPIAAQESTGQCVSTSAQTTVNVIGYRIVAECLNIELTNKWAFRLSVEHADLMAKLCETYGVESDQSLVKDELRATKAGVYKKILSEPALVIDVTDASSTFTNIQYKGQPTSANPSEYDWDFILPTLLSISLIHKPALVKSILGLNRTTISRTSLKDSQTITTYTYQTDDETPSNTQTHTATAGDTGDKHARQVESSGPISHTRGAAAIFGNDLLASFLAGARWEPPNQAQRRRYSRIRRTLFGQVRQPTSRLTVGLLLLPLRPFLHVPPSRTYTATRKEDGLRTLVDSLSTAIDTMQLTTDAMRATLEQMSANTPLAAAIRTVEN